MQEQEWKPSVNPWLIAMSVILPTFMEVLDVSIANVALDHIAGSLSASYDQATWVLTSYLIANAIVLPTTGWLGQRFGRKRILEICLFTFTVASFLCGLAINLPMLLLMRILQGLGGGALQPISMSILMESFPQEKQGQALGLYGFGVVFAPIIGPILGGWLTDNYSWRWVFYINIPVGLLAQWLIHRNVEDPPWIKNALATTFDAFGFFLMAMWLGCQEVFLDKGQEDDWFGSRFICWMVAIALASLIAFVRRELTTKAPVVDLRILRNRNFAVGTVLMTAVGAYLFGMIAILPLFLQTLLGYTAYQSGITMLPRGLGALVAMPIAGRLVNKVDSRLLVGIGFLLFGFSCWQMGHINLSIGQWSLLWPTFINGISIGFLFVPVNTVALGTLATHEMGNGSGIINLMRNVGGSLGVSSLVTMLARRSQVHQTTLVAHYTPYDEAFIQAKQHLLHGVVAHGSVARAMRLLYGLLAKQAALLSYVDIFFWSALLGVVCTLLTFMLKRVKAGRPVMMH
jgi:DHA2 family multidrug resistance protein